VFFVGEQIESRQYPVTVHFNRKTTSDHDFLEEAYRKVCKIHAKLPPGAILVFLTGRREIQQLVKRLKKRFAPKQKQPHSRALAQLQSQAGSATAEHARREAEEEEAEEGELPDMDELEADADAEDADSGAENGDEDKDDAAKDDEEDEAAASAAAPWDPLAAADAALGANAPSPVAVLPLYAMLSPSEQAAVFKPPPPGHRLVS
jgi:ATP-dependent RNA helicase DHX37/DHR1